MEAGAPNVARQDLGVVDGSTQPVLQAVFVLRNTGRDPVTITDLQTSCGCASALLGAGGTSTLPVTLAPGEETSVQATIRLQGLDGPITKLVWIYTRGSALPALTLEIAATVLHAVTVSKRLLDFGVVPAGSSPAQPLTVTVDRRLLGIADVMPGLGLLQPGRACGAAPGVRTPPPRRQTRVARRWCARYSVVVSPQARLGRLFGTLTFAGSSAGTAVYLGRGDRDRISSARGGAVRCRARGPGRLREGPARVRIHHGGASSARCLRQPVAVGAPPPGRRGGGRAGGGPGAPARRPGLSVPP